MYAKAGGAAKKRKKANDTFRFRSIILCLAVQVCNIANVLFK